MRTARGWLKNIGDPELDTNSLLTLLQQYGLVKPGNDTSKFTAQKRGPKRSRRAREAVENSGKTILNETFNRWSTLAGIVKENKDV